MMTKEKYLKALDELVRYADIGRQRHGATGCDIDSYVSDREAWLCELISEHFNPSAYKFDELEDGMWIWDDKLEICDQVILTRVCLDPKTEKTCKPFYVVIYAGEIEYEENRFFPLTKAYQERNY